MDDNKIFKITIASAAIVVITILMVTIGFAIKKNKHGSEIDRITTTKEYSTRGNKSGSFIELSDSTEKNTDDLSAETEEIELTLSDISEVEEEYSYNINEQTAVFSDRRLISISVSPPTKTVYFVGDLFSADGLKVTATYSDGLSDDITSRIKLSTPKFTQPGDKIIKISYSENGITKTDNSLVVRVNNPTIAISKKSLSMTVGDTYSLSANTLPSGCHVSWHTPDDNVVRVSDKGLVTAVSPGFAVVTAELQYGNEYYYDNCTISVSTSNAPSSLNLNSFDGQYLFDDETNELYLTDLSGTFSSNYTITKVKIGVYGPVYINGKYDYIDQSWFWDEEDFGKTKKVRIEDLIDEEYLYADCIPGEEYLVYVYAYDESGNISENYYTITE